MTHVTRTELYDLCTEAALASLQLLANAYTSGDVYAFVFLASSGYEAIAFAYGTRSELQKEENTDLKDLEQLLKTHPHLLQVANTCRTSDFYAEVNAVEWRNDIKLSRKLANSNKIIKKFSAGASPSKSAEIIQGVLLDVVLALRQTTLIRQPAFSNDMLLGVQFPDPLPDEISEVLRISRVVNSDFWHKKMEDGYGI
ncbi:MAG: hypothetical protein U0930_26660 [Pirellulales bacterium]